MAKTNVQGYTVEHDENVKRGVYHLDHVLSADETESMFKNARMSSSIKFEDRTGRNYVLKHKPFGNYTLEKR